MSFLRCLRCLGGEKASPQTQAGNKYIPNEVTVLKSEANRACHAGKLEAKDITTPHKASTRSTASETSRSEEVKDAIATRTGVAANAQEIDQPHLAAETAGQLLVPEEPNPPKGSKQTAESNSLPETVQADQVKAEAPAEQAETKVPFDQVEEKVSAGQVKAADPPAHDVPLAPPAMEVKVPESEQATSKPNSVSRSGSLAAIQAKFDSQPSSTSATPVRAPGSGFNSGVTSPAPLASPAPTPTGSATSSFVRSRAASFTKSKPPQELTKTSSTPGVGSQKNYKWKASSGGGGYMKSAKGRAADFEAMNAASQAKNKPPKQTWKRQGAGDGTGAYKKGVVLDGPVAPKKALSDLP